MFSTFNRIPVVSIGIDEKADHLKIVFASDEFARENYLDLRNKNKVHQYKASIGDDVGRALEKASREILAFLYGPKNSAPSHCQ